MGGGSGDDVRETAQKLYHDVSYVSQGVFSDVYNGGLKTDLSVAFEMPWFSEGTWKKGFRDIEQFHGSGEKNDLNLLGKFKVPSDERWWTEQPEDGLGYLYEFATDETTRNNTTDMEYLRGPTWDLVRNYYRLYKREDEKKGFRDFEPSNDEAWIAVGSRPYTYLSGVDNQQHGSRAGGWFGEKYNYSRLTCRHTLDAFKDRWASVLPEYSGKSHRWAGGGTSNEYSLIVPQSMRITPIVRRFVIRCSIILNQDTFALCFDPIFTIHNPYNVPIEFYGFGALWTKFYPFKLRLNRVDTDENGKARNWPGTQSPTLTYDFSDLMGAEAGQWRLVSRVFAGTTDVNQAPSGVVRLEPGEVKAVFPASSSQANSGLINSQMILSVGDFQYEEASVAAISLNGKKGVNITSSSSGSSSADGSENADASLMFTVDVGPFENAAKTQAFYNDLDMITFNLFYPEGSEGQNLASAEGVQRIWGMGLHYAPGTNARPDGADMGDEHLAQVISFRRYLPPDGGWLNNIGGKTFSRDTGSTKIQNAEKNYFVTIDVQNLGGDDSPLAGPFATNARPWVVDPRSWDANMLERNVGVGWKKMLTQASDMCPVEYRNEMAYWGDGVGAGDGQTNIVLFEIPTAPLVSLGQLQHVECSVLEMEPSYVVGNSYAPIGFKDSELEGVFVWPESGYMRDGVGERVSSIHSPQPRGDLSFAANLNLFDRYFFSGVNFGDADSAQRDDMDAFVEDAFSDDASKNPFPNRRVTLIRDFGDRKEADVKEDFYDPELAGLHGKLLQLDGKFDEISETPFARFMALIGSRAGGFGNVADNFSDEGSGWRWHSKLSDDMLQKLAEAVVEQVRSRGPFMSMGDFVNRRLSGEDEGKAGALQAAIDAADVNKSARSGFGDSGNASNPDDKRYPNLFPTDVASKKAGVPGYVTQGDVLANVGAGLSARSDTFTIRAYGDVSGLTGTPEARAWCEAVVQRVPGGRRRRRNDRRRRIPRELSRPAGRRGERAPRKIRFGKVFAQRQAFVGEQAFRSALQNHFVPVAFAGRALRWREKELMNRCLRTLFFLVSAALFFCVPAAAFAQSRGARSAAPDAAKVGSVTFRCALWQRAGTEVPMLYVKDGNGYKLLQLFEMAFQRSFEYRGPLPIPVFRKATEAEIEQRKAEGVKAADREYIPLFFINPRGMKDFGVIFLPGKFEKKPEREILVFDWSERAFPYGTIRIANFSRRGLIGQLTPKDEKDKAENFRLRQAGMFTSAPIGAKRKIYEIQLAALVNKEPKVVYSSAAAFFGDTRTMIFVIPAAGEKAAPGEAPKLDFRFLKDRRRPQPAPEASDAPSENGKNAAPSRERSPRRSRS